MTIRDEEPSTPRAPGISEAVTRGIRVNVEAQYAPARSQPAQGQWFFLYTIRITNESQDTVQLVSRHWIISDATDHVEEVKGPGVVGHQPVLAPGESFEYTSGCHLPTPFGVMRGTYQMQTQGGDKFESEIAPFYLQGPYSIH
jgi:ApaG protein